MNWIQSISSTLETWVFKKRLLKFSSRFKRDPMACFYCPEMCRFSCPVAEATRNDALTPRGKMSLLHLAERGFSDDEVAGGAEKRQWYLEQCTGCGRCTEYCVHENDVASNLRAARALHWQASAVERMPEGATIMLEVGPSQSYSLSVLAELRGRVLLCERGRKSWWQARPNLLAELDVDSVVDAGLPSDAWAWGELGVAEVRAIGRALSGAKALVAESPADAWFLARGMVHEQKALKASVRTVWQALYGAMAGVELAPGTSMHESFHLTRLLPRLGYSIPMYERGLMPFHHGWNALDCGGEGLYREKHVDSAKTMARRFFEDLGKDGRKLERVVCQSLDCVAHLRGSSDGKTEIVYWLDLLAEELR